MRPGPKPRPETRLRDAAIDYAADLEAGLDTSAAWDRLRHAATSYADADRRRGRPPKQVNF